MAFVGPSISIRNAIVGATSTPHAVDFATAVTATAAVIVVMVAVTSTPDPGSRRDERPVHVHVAREVDEVREVTVLAEELRERNPLTWSGRVELVGRPQHDDHVAAPRGVERVRPVDVGELLLAEHCRNDLLAGVRWIHQVLEGLDDLVANGLVLGGGTTPSGWRPTRLT